MRLPCPNLDLKKLAIQCQQTDILLPDTQHTVVVDMESPVPQLAVGKLCQKTALRQAQYSTFEIRTEHTVVDNIIGTAHKQIVGRNSIPHHIKIKTQLTLQTRHQNKHICTYCASLQRQMEHISVKRYIVILIFQTGMVIDIIETNFD